MSAFAPAVDKGWLLQLFGCPFGAISSVHSWERLGTGLQAPRASSAPALRAHCPAAAVQLILLRLFLLAEGRFVDDAFSAEASAEGLDCSAWAGAEGGSALFQAVVQDLLGWELDGAKRESAVESAQVLGVLVSVIWEGQARTFLLMSLASSLLPVPFAC